MQPLLATLILVLLALLGARVSFSTDHIKAGPALLFRTGIHFLLIGALLGPAGLGLVSTSATQQFFPLMALGLGWVGFHFGLQLDVATLKQFPLSYHVLGVGQAIISFGLFALIGWLFMRGFGLEGEVAAILVIGAAATGCISTPAGIAVVSSNFLVRGRVRDLLFFVSSLDAGVGVIALQFLYSYHRPEGVAPALASLPFWVPMGVALGLGVVCAIVFLWLMRGRPAGEELVLFLLGICAFASGAALQWGLSPLFVAVTMGALVSNLSPDRRRVLALLEKWEKPVYLTFLLVAGALLQVPTAWVAALAIGYAVLRGIVKTAASAALASAIPFGFDVPRRLGLGLIPQGGISLAMAVSGVLMYSGLEIQGVDAGSALFTAVVMGVVISELVGPPLTVSLLRRAGEISPEVERALADGDDRRARREALRHYSGPDRPDSAT
jgi:hypothetical protein